MASIRMIDEEKAVIRDVKLFELGGSIVVTIPSPVIEAWGLKKGEYIGEITIHKVARKEGEE